MGRRRHFPNATWPRPENGALRLSNWHDVIHAGYILPALLDVQRNGNLAHDSAWAILDYYGIDPEDPNLKATPTLNLYHEQFLAKQPDYNTLRAGLSEYYNWQLADLWARVEIPWNVDSEMLMCDVGAGSLAHTNAFLKLFPKSIAVAVDRPGSIGVPEFPNRTHPLELDIEVHQWYNHWHNSFDVVLVSELLHCKTVTGQQAIQNQLRKIIAPGGHLIVVEPADPFMAYRLRHLTGGGHMLGPQEMYKLFEDGRAPKTWNLERQFTLGHWHEVYVYQYVGEKTRKRQVPFTAAQKVAKTQTT